MENAFLLTISFKDKETLLFTSQNESEAVNCLIADFGSEHFKGNSTLFLIGKHTAPDGKEQKFRLALSAVLGPIPKVPAGSKFDLEIVANAQPSIEPPPSTAAPLGEGAASSRELTAQEQRRAALVKKGHVSDKRKRKTDASGNIITTKGKNVHLQLTNLQTPEMHKYVHLYWEKDPISMVPYRLGEQRKEIVKLSILKMQENPVLRGRPESVLQRKAEKYVSYLNIKHENDGKKCEEGVVWERVKKLMKAGKITLESAPLAYQTELAAQRREDAEAKLNADGGTGGGKGGRRKGIRKRTEFAEIDANRAPESPRKKKKTEAGESDYGEKTGSKQSRHGSREHAQAGEENSAETDTDEEIPLVRLPRKKGIKASNKEGRKEEQSSADARKTVDGAHKKLHAVGKTSTRASAKTPLSCYKCGESGHVPEECPADAPAVADQEGIKQGTVVPERNETGLAEERKANGTVGKSGTESTDGKRNEKEQEEEPGVSGAKAKRAQKKPAGEEGRKGEETSGRSVAVGRKEASANEEQDAADTENGDKGTGSIKTETGDDKSARNRKPSRKVVEAKENAKKKQKAGKEPSAASLAEERRKRARLQQQVDAADALLKLDMANQSAPIDRVTEAGSTAPASSPSLSSDVIKSFYFPPGAPDAVSISSSDLRRLAPGEFLSDELVDFYIKFLLKAFVQQAGLAERIYLFNSFFFKRVTELVKEGKNLQQLKKWTKRLDIFDKQYLFIPVIKGQHCSLQCIVYPSGEDTSKKGPEQKIKGEGGTPCILQLDSMAGGHLDVEIPLRRYLSAMWLAKNPKTKEETDSDGILPRFSAACMPFVPVEVPQQANYFDCGAFLLHYMELFLENPPAIFDIKKKNARGLYMMKKNWFHASDVDHKRLHIKRIIIGMAKELEAGNKDILQPGALQALWERTSVD